MSEKTSPAMAIKYGIDMVCKVWKFPRSSFYHAKKRLGKDKGNRGRCPSVPDDQLLEAIEKDIADSHFQGEGHRKIHVRLKRSKRLCVGRNRVLKVMKEHKLLSPTSMGAG